MAGVNFKRLLYSAAAFAAPLFLASPSAHSAMATGTVTVVVTTSGGGGVNDYPTMTDQTMTAIVENQGAGISAGVVTANDPDVGDTLSFAITVNSASLFAINSTTGEITTTGSLDFEAASSHTLTVQVTDTGSLTAEATITIPVGNVDETPPVVPVANTGNDQNNTANPDAVVEGSTTNRAFSGAGSTTGGTEVADSPPTTETTTEDTTAAAADSGTAATGGEPTAAQRFARDAQSASQLFGQPTSIGLVGKPNQHYSVTLPGQTAFATGSEVVNVAGFSHNAGLTPALSGGGAGTFAVGAQLSAAGGDSVGSVSVDSGGETGGGDTGGGDTGGGGTESAGTASGGETGGDTGEGGGDSEGGDTGAGPLVFAGPIVTCSPYVPVTVSFN